ncbi:MAG TPA: DUF6600 domain-containing protein [Rhizobacter sp.]|nr:DUF6600 domain-containing protein [Rhizobacter sp.]
MKHPHTAARLRLLRPASWLGLFFGLVLLSLLARPVQAQPAEPADPPDRVGRLAELNGQVWTFATDTNEWITAVRNRPITTGDRLSTEADGRAEVRVGSSVLRIGPNTEIEVTQLDDDHLGLRLRSGSMTARLRTREAANEFSLVTDEGRFRIENIGSYRFDRFDETSHATALSGQAVYESDGTQLTVMQGQQVEFWKERGGPQYAISGPRRDDLSNWSAARDAVEEGSYAKRYVSPEMTGAEDLDRYGAWEQTPEYGAVWTPHTVVTGWAPYRMGHWAWVRPWGWTWVDDAPWGFAPFHYGRWVYFRNNWCWAPGRYVARPVYAPALVAWVGGAGVSVGVSVGHAPTVGWFPLGPREVYVPGYRVSPRYVRNVNVTHVTNITNVTTIINSPGQYMANAHYVNRGAPRAVTVVPSTVVERRQPVAPAVTRVNDQVMRDMGHEHPRAEPPVAAPPRWAGGGGRPAVADPRVSRPGFAPARPVAGPSTGTPAVPPRGNGGSVGNGGAADRAHAPPSVAVPAPRPQEAPPARIGYGGRDNQTPPSAQTPPPGVNAQPQVNQPGWGGPRGTEMRNHPQPPVPPREMAPVPDRALAPPPHDERKRHHEMPGPPRAAVQAPAPAQAPQMQAPRPQPPQPAQPPAVQPPQVQAPPAVRPPQQMHMPHQNSREQSQPQQQAQQPAQQQQPDSRQREDRPQRGFSR